MTSAMLERRVKKIRAARGNPLSRMVVSLSYRRGVDHPIVIRSGALQGAGAELLIVPRGIPHLWALTDRFVLTVGGDLSRAELLDVAESLREHP